MPTDEIEPLDIPLVPNPLEKGLVVKVMSCQLPNIIVIEGGFKKTIPSELEGWLPMAESLFPCSVEFGQLASFPLGKIYAEIVEDDGSEFQITRKDVTGKRDEIGAQLIDMLDNPAYNRNENMLMQILGNLELLSRNEKAFQKSIRSTGYYIFKILADKEEFFKGGIAYDPKSRASQIRSELKSKCKKVSVEIVQSAHAPDRPSAENLEQQVLHYAEIMEIKYQPKVDFAGHSECFTCNPFDTIDLDAAEFMLKSKLSKTRERIPDYGTGKYATLYVMGELKEESLEFVFQDSGLVLARIEWQKESSRIFEYDTIVDFMLLDISGEKVRDDLIESISRTSDLLSVGKCSHRCGVQFRIDEKFKEFIDSGDIHNLEIFKCQ